MEPTGTIIFSTVGRPHYGFDLFSVDLTAANFDGHSSKNEWTERRLSDGVSINSNGQFYDEDRSVVFISERSGSARIYSQTPRDLKPRQIPTVTNALFHDRPTLNNNRLYFTSLHEPSGEVFQSSSAVYCTNLDDGKTVRLTPRGAVDYSPAVSRSGKLVAVASYGFKSWEMEFNELRTDIVVFPASDPSNRIEICAGGWPAWSGDSTIYFHRVADDGWWSVFRVDLPENILDVFEKSSVVAAATPRRITPTGLHAFTPAASHGGELIAVATRRKREKAAEDFRQVEIFNVKENTFHAVTERINPNSHHLNPFFSPESGSLGYHRYRGVSTSFGESSVIPHLERVNPPAGCTLQMLRVNGEFPSVSPDGNFVAFNFIVYNPEIQGLYVIKSDGSKRWNLIKRQNAFGTVWDPVEKGVIYTAIGPIFAPNSGTIHIARVSFDPSHLNDADREEIKSDVKILTKENTGNNGFPSVSPDGKHVVFRSGRNGNRNLYVMDAVDGEHNGDVRQLTDGPWIDTMPCWSPDGEFIAFSSTRHNPEKSEFHSLYLIRPDGTGLRRIHVAGREGSAEADRERINHVWFSKDSKWLLFTANMGGVSAEPISLPNQYQPFGELFVCRVDGSGLQRLTWNAYENGTCAWNWRDDLDVGSMSMVDGHVAGEPLLGAFFEPLWLTCDVGAGKMQD
ncbi:hypothetical protein Scep_008772 [Stephania cephalantha]|uniref:Uncharacterized protein n=1 Tax=Stephania cephalantha TaxID=152367 RepID=A0AAP0PFN7_9MAGN